ncbi:MAG: flagellar motor switch protein FliM [Burkholderiales bacterium]
MSEPLVTDTPADEPADAESPPLMADATARDIDLSEGERLVRKPMPALEAVNDRFLRNLRVGLFQLIRRSPEVAIDPVQVQRFSEFAGALPAPASFNLVSMLPLRGSAVVICDGALVSALVDALYGGAGKAKGTIEGRDFSPTEQRVIQRLIGVVCAEYNKAWLELYPLNMAHQRSEAHLQFVTIAAPAEMVVATTLRITVGGFEGTLRICTPYAALEPIRDVLYGAQHAKALAEDRRWVNLLTREIQAAEITLMAEIGRPELTVEQLLTMKRGDFIPFDRPSRIALAVDGTPLFNCQFGTHNARYALSIEECLRGEQSHWLGGLHVG